MDSLAKCPFCGGEAKRSSETFERTILSWVYCQNCGVAGGYRHTEAEAIAAWNTRAELTCREYGSVRVWQTCNVWSHELSCGHEVDTLESEPPNYCPNCGAKVIADSWTTCKCGESIELGDRESAVCPSCERTMRE